MDYNPYAVVDAAIENDPMGPPDTTAKGEDALSATLARMRSLRAVADAAFDASEEAESERWMQLCRDNADRLYPQVAALAQVAQAEAMASIAESLARIDARLADLRTNSAS